MLAHATYAAVYFADARHVTILSAMPLDAYVYAYAMILLITHIFFAAAAA